MRSKFYRCPKCERNIKVCAPSESLLPAKNKIPEHECKKIEKTAKGIKTQKRG